MAKPRATEIVTGCPGDVFGGDSRVDSFIDAVGKAGRMVEIEG